ncbi:HIT family protein [Lacticaseibacillus pantheris]|uniref:HIT family protein n=1 Tax=Lacticaseibacillus pantheris TaxID=171523 RepID=UPI0009E95DF5
MSNDCPFCNLEHNKVILQNNTCIGFFDLSPVSRGHLLIIPRRHAETFFDLTETERSDMLKLLDEGRQLLDLKQNPDGYNVGWNCGMAAGQTVMHFHCHLIPRFTGDTPNPRGGVRGVIPKKQHYEFDVLRGYPSDRAVIKLIDQFNSELMQLN